MLESAGGAPAGVVEAIEKSGFAGVAWEAGAALELPVAGAAGEPVDAPPKRDLPALANIPGPGAADVAAVVDASWILLWPNVPGLLVGLPPKRLEVGLLAGFPKSSLPAGLLLEKSDDVPGAEVVAGVEPIDPNSPVPPDGVAVLVAPPNNPPEVAGVAAPVVSPNNPDFWVPAPPNSDPPAADGVAPVPDGVTLPNENFGAPAAAVNNPPAGAELAGVLPD